MATADGAMVMATTDFKLEEIQGRPSDDRHIQHVPEYRKVSLTSWDNDVYFFKSGSINLYYTTKTRVVLLLITFINHIITVLRDLHTWTLTVFFRTCTALYLYTYSI